MARAIVLGAVNAGVLGASEIVVCDPDQSKWGAFRECGVRVTASHGEAVGSLGEEGEVLLAVKPQSLGAVAEAVRDLWPSRPVVVVSILAGTPSARVREALGGDGRGVRVVRAMPNLAASVGASATALSIGAGAVAGDEAFAAKLFEGVGPLVARIEEGMMDAFTAVAGSGPAYAFYLAEGMVKGAMEAGFDAALARELVTQTLVGAATLLSRSEDAPGALRAAVTSKGGTTEAAVRVLDERGVMEAVAAAIEAARRRGAELGNRA
jgi:pyrroline-5-carboxylate reductase